LTNLVGMIDACVISKPKPAVYISGGLDSAILLHHLTENATEKIYTYTARFNLDGDELVSSQMTAEYYGTKHQVVDCSEMVQYLPEILRGFDHPRYNIWPYFLALQAKKDSRQTVYIGEGADEHFGGYVSKGYLEAWADHSTYITSMYKKLHEKLGLKLEIPFDRLDWRKTIKFYKPPDKALLREAYQHILPPFVIEKPKTPPAFTRYWQLWYLIKKDFPNFKPKTVDEIKKILRFLACKAWLETNELCEYKLKQK